MLASYFTKARYQFADHFGSIVSKGGDVDLEAKRLVRERPDCYGLGNNSALILIVMQVRRPANRIGREKSQLLDGSNQ
jgi:hypothetical protein